MAEKKVDGEIVLKRVEIDEKALKDADSCRLFQCELIWPRVGTASRSSSLAIELAKGKWSSEGRLWSESVVTKDSIQGRIGIAVGVTGKVSDSIVAYFARTAGSSLVKLVAGMVGDFATGLAGDLLSLPIAAAAKAVAKEPQPEMLYKAAIDFDTATLPAAGESIELELPLVAAEDISKVIRKTTPKGSGASTTRKIARKGDKVGTCAFSIKVL